MTLRETLERALKREWAESSNEHSIVILRDAITEALTQLEALERDREALARFVMHESRRAQTIYEAEDVIIWNMSGEELVKRFVAILGTQEQSHE